MIPTFMLTMIFALCAIGSMFSFYLSWKARRQYEAELADIVADEQRFNQKMQQEFRDLRNDRIRKEQLKHLERRTS